MKVGFAPLQLEGYYVDHIHCGVAAAADKEINKVDLLPGLHMRSPRPTRIPQYGVMVGFDAAQNEKDKQRYRLELRVSSGDEEENPLPYHFDITLVGFFRLIRIKAAPRIEPFMIRDAAAILYSSAREVLASVTGRGPFPAIVLPVVLFDLDLAGKVPPPKAIASASSKQPRRTRTSKKK